MGSHAEHMHVAKGAECDPPPPRCCHATGTTKEQQHEVGGELKLKCGSERLDKSDHSVCWKKLHNS